MIICFAIFFINDGDAFINWTKRQNKQHEKGLLAVE